MIIKPNTFCTLYAGTAQDPYFLEKELVITQLKNKSLDQLRLTKPFNELHKKLNVEQIIFLHQVHGTNGHLVMQENKNSFNPFTQTGDYLITHQPNIALAILTADCLPVVIVDTVQHIIGIAHAGWKGAVAGVVPTMIEQFKKSYNSLTENLIAYVLPSAQVCCYEIKKDVAIELEKTGFASQVIDHKNDTLYFNLPGLIAQQLMNLNVKTNLEYNTCTIHNKNYHSHRRDGVLSGRQVNIICLANA